jgi:hypothetical protein
VKDINLSGRRNLSVATSATHHHMREGKVLLTSIFVLYGFA